MSAPDDLLARLAALPPPDPLDDVAAERVRRRAHAVLAEERRFQARPRWAPVRRAWSTRVMPALVSITVGSYLWWAVEAASSLYQ